VHNTTSVVYVSNVYKNSRFVKDTDTEVRGRKSRKLVSRKLVSWNVGKELGRRKKAENRETERVYSFWYLLCKYWKLVIVKSEKSQNIFFPVQLTNLPTYQLTNFFPPA